MSHEFVRLLRQSITGNIDSESTYTTKHGRIARSRARHLGRLMHAPRSHREYRTSREMLNLEADQLLPVLNCDLKNLQLPVDFAQAVADDPAVESILKIGDLISHG